MKWRDRLQLQADILQDVYDTTAWWQFFYRRRIFARVELILQTIRDLED